MSLPVLQNKVPMKISNNKVLENYGLPVKLEAGFYSNSLVNYLVDFLHMLLSEIKYKIISKRALKPDNFKDFLLYTFENFLEKEAKAMTNSFIGQLGQKYDRKNQGLTCTEYNIDMEWRKERMGLWKTITVSI